MIYLSSSKILNKGGDFNLSVEEILTYLHCEIDRLDDEVTEYRSAMDRCEPFGSKYWLYHDKYQAAFINKSYLANVIKHI